MKQLIFLLRPTAIESVVYTFGVIAFLVITSWNAILDALISDRVSSEDVLSSGGVFSENVDSFLGTFDNTGLAATATTLVFWSAVGAIVYMVIWGAINGFNDAYKDTATANYVKGQNIASQSRWQGPGARLMFRITTLILSIAYIITFLRLLLPLWQELFTDSMNQFGSASGLAQLILAIFGGVVSVHIFTILARLLMLRLRVRGTIDFEALR